MGNSQLWAEISVKLTVMGRFLTLISTTVFFSCGRNCENWPISLENPSPPGRPRGAGFAGGWGGGKAEVGLPPLAVEHGGGALGFDLALGHPGEHAA